MTQNCNCHGSGDKHTQTVAAVLERPRYSPGLILEDSDLTSAVEYTRSLSRLLFRNLFGCGVICGLVVSVKEECGLNVTVAPGLALDGCGDPIEVPGSIRITLDTAEVEKLKNRPQDKGPPEFWVVLCGREKMCAPRALLCDADDFDGVTQPTRIRALAEVSLAFTRPECACGCQWRPRRDVAAPQPGQPVPPSEGADEQETDCHYDHANRIECAPDCGCGTACACGCCVLLARVAYVGVNGEFEWQAKNRGVRRLIRPAMLPDPADRRPGWTSTALPADFYWADIDDSERERGMNALYRESHVGDAITQEMVMNVANWADDQRGLRQSADEAKAAEKAEAKAMAKDEARAKAEAKAKARAKARAEARAKAKAKAEALAKARAEARAEARANAEAAAAAAKEGGG